MTRGVLANEIQHQDGVVNTCEHNTKIEIMDVHKKLSCTAVKNKTTWTDAKNWIEYIRVFKNINRSVNRSL